MTELIQQTFRYYYVAIFTLEQDPTLLHFRSSATPKVASRPRRKRCEPTAVALEVEVGQVIGQAASSGERILVNDVQKDTRYRFIDYLPGRVRRSLSPETGRAYSACSISRAIKWKRSIPMICSSWERWQIRLRMLEGARLYSNLPPC